MKDRSRVIIIKKRRSGETLAWCNIAAAELEKGGTPAIIGNNEDYLNRIKYIFSHTLKISVEFTPITDMRPKNNMKMHYDEQGEPEWLEILPQTKEIIGWKITKK